MLNLFYQILRIVLYFLITIEFSVSAYQYLKWDSKYLYMRRNTTKIDTWVGMGNCIFLFLVGFPSWLMIFLCQVMMMTMTMLMMVSECDVSVSKLLGFKTFLFFFYGFGFGIEKSIGFGIVKI